MRTARSIRLAIAVTARSQVADALAEEIAVLKGIETIDPTEEIQLGDVIHTDHGRFFVAVASDEFTVDGQSYQGISTESPLFQAHSSASIMETP